jgi:hypothetical protein
MEQLEIWIKWIKSGKIFPTIKEYLLRQNPWSIDMQVDIVVQPRNGGLLFKKVHSYFIANVLYITQSDNLNISP